MSIEKYNTNRKSYKVEIGKLVKLLVLLLLAILLLWYANHNYDVNFVDTLSS